MDVILRGLEKEIFSRVHKNRKTIAEIKTESVKRMHDEYTGCFFYPYKLF